MTSNYFASFESDQRARMRRGSPVSALRNAACALVAIFAWGVSATGQASVLPYPPLVSETFNPSSTLTGEVSTMTISFSNPNASAIDGVSFSDVLPGGILNSSLSIDNTCGGLVSRPEDYSVSFSGGSIPVEGCSVEIPVVGVVAGSFENYSGEVDSSNAPPGGGATATLTVGDGAVLAAPIVTKSFAPAAVPPGGIAHMRITLANPDASRAITLAHFSDIYPAGMAQTPFGVLVSNDCQGDAIPNGTSLTLDNAIVPAGGSCSVIINMVGTSTATNSTGPVTSQNALTGLAATATLTVSAGALLDAPTVTKAFTPDHVLAGDSAATSVMAITLTNADPYDIAGVAFTDNYPTPLHMANAPSGVVFANTCGGTLAAAPNGTLLALSGGVVPANQSCVVKVQVVGTSAGVSTNHTGPVTSDNALVGADASAVLTVTGGVAAPDLMLTKSHAGNFSQGQTGATYTLIATNSGAAPTAGAVSVVDTLPGALTATDMSGPGWTCDLQTTSCTRSDQLAPGTSYPAITLTVDVASMAPAGVTNTATVSGGGETDTGNDTASDPTTIDSASQSADLTLTKSHNGNFSQGQAGATYLLVAHNIGAAASNGTVVVADALPGALTVTGMSGPGWTCNLQTTSCTRSDPVGPGGSYSAITLIVDVAANAPPSVLNTATVSGGGETNAANDTASDLATVTQSGGVTAQTITFMSTAPNNAQVAGQSYHVAAGASSGLPVALTIDPSSATVCQISNDIVSFIGAGTCTIDANQGGDATYAPAPQVQQSLAVAPAGGVTPQAITFTSAAPVNAVVTGPSYVATATASSGLPVVLTIDGASATVCTIDSGTVSFIGAGVCTIDADQGGDATYAAASERQQSFDVASAGGLMPQSITFTSTGPNNAKVAGPAYLVMATASSALPVVLTIDGSSATVCTIGNDMVNFIGAGACTIDANQGGDATYAVAPQAQQSFTVASAGGITPQTIAFTSAAPGNATVSGATYLATATATSGLPIVLTIDGPSETVCSINNGTVSFVGAGTCTIDANQGGDATYALAPEMQQSFSVASAGGVTSQAITFTSTAPNNAVVAGLPYQATATASSNLPVVLAIDALSDMVCLINDDTVTFIGAGICTIDANQGGDATYAPAPEKQQSFPVASAGGAMAQIITFTSVAPIEATVGGPTYLATATASSGLSVVLTIDALSDAVCTINDGTVSFIGAGTCTVDANQGGDAIYLPAPEAQQALAVLAVGDTIFRNGFEGP